jgi:predicted transcriptional regulator
LEYAVMTALWTDGPVTVRQLRRRFPLAAYTTLMTTLDRMSKKGLLARERRGRPFVYRAAMTRSELRTAIAECILNS